jgi:hypothetical protein
MTLQFAIHIPFPICIALPRVLAVPRVNFICVRLLPKIQPVVTSQNSIQISNLKGSLSPSLDQVPVALFVSICASILMDRVLVFIIITLKKDLRVLVGVVACFGSVGGFLLGTTDLAAVVDGSKAKPTPLGTATAADVTTAIHTADCLSALWAAFVFPFFEEVGQFGGDVGIGETGQRRVSEGFAGCADEGGAGRACNGHGSGPFGGF